MKKESLKQFIINNNLSVINNTKKLEINIQYKNSTILKIPNSDFLKKTESEFLVEIDTALNDVQVIESATIYFFKENIAIFEGLIDANVNIAESFYHHITVKWQGYISKEIILKSCILSPAQALPIQGKDGKNSLDNFTKLIEEKIKNPGEDKITDILDDITNINEEIKKINKASEGLMIAEKMLVTKFQI